MLIILEGPDGAGKSTFADLIHAEIERRHPDDRVERLHRSMPQQDIFFEYENDLDHYTPGRHHHVICDRWHWGEMIYGPLYRGPDAMKQFGLPGFRHVELMLQRLGAVLCYITNDEDVLLDRQFRKGEDFLRPEHLLEVMRGYEEWYVRSSLMRCRMRDPDALSARAIVNIATGQEAKRWAWFVGIQTYVGPINPNVLLLGERRKDDRSKYAFVPRPSTSGRFLLEALEERLDRFGLANALEDSIHELVRRLDRPHVVTLGRAAHLAASSVGIQHAAVPHPQYVRRFHHAKKEEYGRLIAAVAGTSHEETGWPNSSRSSI